MSVGVAVFASGSGTNLQALLDHFADGRRGAHVALVLSDRSDAAALDRAAEAGVAGRVIAVAGRAEEEVAAEMLRALEEAGVGIIALAGYLRLVPAAVVRRYAGRMVNVHPALLPAFGGKGMYGAHVHRAVLAAGAAVTGVTVHLVDERYDEGRILAQWPVPVRPGDSPSVLGARVLRAEHALYPAAVEWLAGVLGDGPRDPHEAVVTALRGRRGADGGFRWADGAGADPEGVRRMLGMD